MSLSIAIVMGRGPRIDSRLRYIFHHGIVPWGIVAGVCAALGAAFGLRNDAASATPASLKTIIVVAALAFVVWCMIAGWVVGVIRWEMRRTDRRQSTSDRRRR